MDLAVTGWTGASNEDGPADAGDRRAFTLDVFTAKQREVLDLLIEHKTSKEISRALGISPYTVDQRINMARAKLNLASRAEVAHVYRGLLTAYQQSIYEPSYIAEPPIRVDIGRRDDTEADTPAPVLHLAPMAQAIASEPMGSTGSAVAQASGGTVGRTYFHVLPEMFDGPYGTVLRLALMAGIALFLMLVVLGGMTMFSQLGALMDR